MIAYIERSLSKNTTETYFKDDLRVGRHGNTIAIGQSQRFVVVQHRVEILNPDGVDGTVQQQPYVLVLQVRLVPQCESKICATQQRHERKYSTSTGVLTGFE